MRQGGGEALPDVDCVAREAGVSRFHFTRLFKAVFGVTPRECRAQAQLDRAKQLLVVERRSVTETCMASGFSSLGSFSGGFTRRVGVAPSVFQRKFAADPAGPDAPGELPRELTPGCLMLMAGWPEQKSKSEEAGASASC